MFVREAPGPGRLIAKKVCTRSASHVLSCTVIYVFIPGPTDGDDSGQSGDDAAPTEPQEGDCRYSVLSPQPDLSDAMWQGNDPMKGSMYAKSCFVRVTQAGVVDGLAWRPFGYAYGQGGDVKDLPPVDPRKLIEDTASKKIPAPEPHFGPSAATIAVKVPVWLWINDPGTVTVVAGAGDLTVTATAEVTKTTWSMGDSVTDPGSSPVRSVAEFTCPGLGEAPPAGVDQTSKPPCGYTYRWMSTASRTDGACAWPVTITATWLVTWSATTGEAGRFTMEANTTTSLRVGEWRSALVSGNSSGGASPTPSSACRA